jgi:hypothetical protein
MTRMQAVRCLRSAALIAAAVGSFAQCSDWAGERALVAPDGVRAAKAAATSVPSVTAADPPFGKQGEVGYRVRITGSGFEPGAQASWERNGVPDPKLTVRSTEYVSSTELVATIDIASDAELDLYDVAVMSGRGKGIGTEMFEVTDGTSIGTLDGSNTLVRGINSSGQATGYSGTQTFFWDPATWTMTDVGPGNGWDIEEAGNRIVGVSGSHATLWTRTATGWLKEMLPRDAAAISSRAGSIGSDPVTGEAIFIAGEERFREGHRPRLWRRTPSGWVKIVLPLATAKGNGSAHDVNGRGQVVGRVMPSKGSPFGVLWEPDGTYLIGPGGQGINPAGTITVFTENEVAYYMELRNGTWTGPHRLPGSCAYALAVDDAGRIAATKCVDGDRTVGALFVPPYDENGPMYLGGLGDRTDGSWIEAISPRNGWLGGTAPTRPVKPGVIWNPLLRF